MNLSESSLEEAIVAISKMADREPGLSKKPTMLYCYPPYLKKCLRILGLIKQPIARSASIRKRKRALYWRKTV